VAIRLDRGYHPDQSQCPGATPMRNIIIGLVGLLALAASPALAADAANQEANKKTVVEFYEQGINRKDFDAAAKFIGPRYVQHNPTGQDGAEGFKAFLGFLREKFPDSHSEIKQVFADGDYVILHVHSVREKGSRGRAIVDIFKLENGKIVEHWDVVQDIPEKSANSNGMF
jgi:predicted SnoaL-like aldol condensation-catalyzing enzyme